MRSLAERASFRDPAGRVVERDGVLLRLIAPSFVPAFRAVQRSGLLDELQRDELLVRHEELPATPRDGAILRPERVPFITYPYEWTPGQLRDAALLTLDVAERAFRRAQDLRDASAYNIQFHRGRPTLIDSLSFEPRKPGAPWMAYGQFCRHFLGPLALSTLVDPELLRLAAVYPDGVPVSVASHALGRRGWMRPGILLHLHLHAVAEARAQRVPVRGPVSVPDRQIQQTLDGLRSTIEALPSKAGRSTWLGYRGGAHYDDVSRQEKETFVSAAMERVRPASLWDLGANRGEWTFRHAPPEGYALALDADLGCAEACYAQAKRDRAPVVSLWGDLLAPASASGWANEERASLSERGPADLVLALALVHHLCITGRVPLERVAQWLSHIARNAVVEVPDRDDPMVLRLADGQKSAPRLFGRVEFRAAITSYFEILAERDLGGLSRTLFLLRSLSS